MPTPLLVPSFSSRGFGSEPDGSSSIAAIYGVAKEFITETLLVSAFDLHHGYLPNPGPVADLVFVDSGGYEKSTTEDLSAFVATRPAEEEWNQGLHRTVLTGWTDQVPAVFVTYDKYAPLRDQIAQGLEQLESLPRQLHALLLKPEDRNTRTLNPMAIAAHGEHLRRFGIIGVTEKELGSSVLERLTNLARLRQFLNQGGVDAPIHVFGGLDPLSVILYYVVGAEIFDGLTWLRYGFVDGKALYKENFNVLQIAIDSLPATARSHMLTENLKHLTHLRLAMRRYAHSGDVDEFGQFASIVGDVLTQVEHAMRR